MFHDKVTKEFNQVLKAEKNHAQILIELSTSSKTIGEARRIIEDSGVSVIEITHLSSKWVLVKLDLMDMRDVALKLTEKGFYINGINAL